MGSRVIVDLREVFKGFSEWRIREIFELSMPLLVWCRKNFWVVFGIPKKIEV